MVLDSQQKVRGHGLWRIVDRETWLGSISGFGNSIESFDCSPISRRTFSWLFEHKHVRLSRRPYWAKKRFGINSKRRWIRLNPGWEGSIRTPGMNFKPQKYTPNPKNRLRNPNNRLRTPKMEFRTPGMGCRTTIMEYWALRLQYSTGRMEH
jgi:hypothetical protein